MLSPSRSATNAGLAPEAVRELEYGVGGVDIAQWSATITERFHGDDFDIDGFISFDFDEQAWTRASPPATSTRGAHQVHGLGPDSRSRGGGTALRVDAAASRKGRSGCCLAREVAHDVRLERARRGLGALVARKRIGTQPGVGVVRHLR